MIGSIVILGVSVALFAYWFRYTCLLILQTKPAQDYASEVAATIQLGLPEVRACLQAQSGDLQLQALSQSLDRDYRLLTGLLGTATGFQAGSCSLEERLLRIDYALMRVWYSVTRRFSGGQARKALAEMAEIIGHLADVLGQRAIADSQA